MDVSCVCASCGKGFVLPGWAVKRGRGKYCSHACYAVGNRGSARPSLRRRMQKVCPVCGQTFETGGRAGRRDQVVCSMACQNKSRYRHGSVCVDLDPLDAAYLAGFWDGEGSFIIHGSTDRRGITFRAVAVASKPIVIEWVKAVTGIGAVVTYDAQNPKWAPRWTWTVNGDAAETFTRQLLPYLKLKRDQAELGLAFMERLRDPALKADLAWQEEWRQRMRDLNRRGPVVSTRIKET